MIEELLPAEVSAADTTEDVVDAQLYLEEERVIRVAVAKRRSEFTTVRACGRAALIGLGHPPGPIVPGERGAPRWADGVVGSMTHCQGYRAAAVARASDLLGLGIDAEARAPLPSGVLELIASPAERSMLAALGEREPAMPWGILLFSAKESVYKTWFPLARRWLGFDEAHIDIQRCGHFVADLLVPGPVVAGRTLSRFTGRWLVRDGLVLTAIAVS